MINLLNGNCLDLMRSMPDNSVDSIVTDPPYGLNFMGKKWDCSVPSVEIWAECLRVLKPGGHLLVFAGTRTQHRMAVNIEDAGFEIRDMIAWVYGSGFPKSMDVSKAIDKVGGDNFMEWFPEWLEEYRVRAGISRSALADHFPSKSGGRTGCVWNWEHGIRTPSASQFNQLCKLLGIPVQPLEVVERQVLEQRRGVTKTFNVGSTDTIKQRNPITAPATDAARQWQGWGTALKPALEPITMARKPFASTVAANVLEHGTGALNIDGCRVEYEDDCRLLKGGSYGGNRTGAAGTSVFGTGDNEVSYQGGVPEGRWPANLIHDGSGEVRATFPQAKGQQGDLTGHSKPRGNGIYGDMAPAHDALARIESDTSAARFFYAAKASKKDREEGLGGAPDRVLAMSNQAKAELARGNMHEGESGMNTAKVRKNHHPTVKPTDLMRYLCRLVTPPKGIVLDPFMGSGSTGKAAVLEGFSFVGMELDADYFKIAQARVSSSNQSDSGQCGLFDGVQP